MNQLKSIYNSLFKDSHSHPIHTCFPIIASNVTLVFSLGIIFRFTQILSSGYPEYLIRNRYNMVKLPRIFLLCNINVTKPSKLTYTTKKGQSVELSTISNFDL